MLRRKMVHSCSPAKHGTWVHAPYFKHSVIQKEARCAESWILYCFPGCRHCGDYKTGPVLEIRWVQATSDCVNKTKSQKDNRSKQLVPRIRTRGILQVLRWSGDNLGIAHLSRTLLLQTNHANTDGPHPVSYWDRHKGTAISLYPTPSAEFVPG